MANGDQFKKDMYERYKKDKNAFGARNESIFYLGTIYNFKGQAKAEYDAWKKGGMQSGYQENNEYFMDYVTDSDKDELARRSRVVQSIADSSGRSGPKYGGKAGKVINAANNMAGNSNILSFDNKKQNILGI